MQEMAWTHASHLGYGFQSTREQGCSWVIARQRIEMIEWLNWEEEVTIRTWLRPPGAVIVTRDFEFLSNGKKVGEASAHWLTISHQTRRPTKLPFSDNPNQFRYDQHLSLEPGLLKLENSGEALALFAVRPSDLDMNGHVNNTRFSQWILDSLSLSLGQSFLVIGYQTNFLAEVKLGDEVAVCALPQTDLTGGSRTMLFLGRRRSNGEKLFLAEVSLGAG